MSTEESIPQRAAATPAPPTSFRPAAVLVAQYKALKNDLQQAQELTAEIECRLSAKTNECASLKRNSEALTAELEQLRAERTAYREERLKLANEVARIAGLEFRLKRMGEERDSLRSEVEQLRARVAAQQTFPGAREVVRELAAPLPFPVAGEQEPLCSQDRVYAKRLLKQLVASLDELRDVVDPDPARTPAAPATDAEIISIKFGP